MATRTAERAADTRQYNADYAEWLASADGAAYNAAIEQWKVQMRSLRAEAKVLFADGPIEGYLAASSWVDAHKPAMPERMHFNAPLKPFHQLMNMGVPAHLHPINY